MVDGYTSASALIQFIQALNPKVRIEYKLSYDKSHGLTFKNLTEYTKDEFDLFIIPDASMTCFDARQITNNFSGKILVLDHHLVELEYLDTQTGKWITKIEADEISQDDSNRIEEDVYTNYCVAVNCHDGQYPNPDLSGVGVVQKFIEAYVEEYGSEDDIDSSLTEEYLDLVSLGMIADAIDSRSLETRYYMLEGLKPVHYKNELLKEMELRLAEDMKNGRTILSIGWKIAPLINGTIRYGKKDEQDALFEAILGVKRDVQYQPRRKSRNDLKPPLETHSLQWDVARVCVNVKSRQDTAVRKNMAELETIIEKDKLYENSVLFLDGTKILEKGTISGLVANKLASKYFRPVVLMRERDAEHYGGSGRGYDKGNIEDFNGFLSEVGVSCSGHKSAFGVLFKKDTLQEVIKKCNEKCPVDSLVTYHQVDWEIPANKLKRAYIADVASNYAIWGNGVPEPQFAITDLHINASSIMAYGENQGFIRFTYNGITFTKKYCPAGDYDKMTMRTRKTFGVNKTPLVLNIIGQFVLNAWEDKVNPEVKILYYDVQKDESKEESKQIKNTEIHKTKTLKTQIYDGGTSYTSEVAKVDSGEKTLVNSQSESKKKKSEDEDVEVWILDGNVEDKPKKKTLTIDDDFLF